MVIASGGTPERGFFPVDHHDHQHQDIKVATTSSRPCLAMLDRFFRSIMGFSARCIPPCIPYAVKVCILTRFGRFIARKNLHKSLKMR